MVLTILHRQLSSVDQQHYEISQIDIIGYYNFVVSCIIKFGIYLFRNTVLYITHH